MENGFITGSDCCAMPGEDLAAGKHVNGWLMFFGRNDLMGRITQG